MASSRYKSCHSWDAWTRSHLREVGAVSKVWNEPSQWRPVEYEAVRYIEMSRIFSGLIFLASQHSSNSGLCFTMAPTFSIFSKPYKIRQLILTVCFLVIFSDHIPANPRVIKSLNPGLGIPPLNRLCVYGSVMHSHGAIALRFGWVNRDAKLICEIATHSIISPMSSCEGRFLSWLRRHQKTHITTTDPLHQRCLATHVIES